MIKAFSSPGKFYLGDGVLEKLGSYIVPFGKKAVLIAHPDDSNRVSEQLKKAEAEDVKFINVAFPGECTEAAIATGRAAVQEHGAQVVVGLGGGKALDTAKAVAHFENKPMISVPTIASTDAPCSTLAVVYHEDHSVETVYCFPRNPDVVVADSGVIAKAPVRFLVAGIGDAYATYFEARSCMRSYAQNYVGGVSTQAAFKLAELCYDVLRRDAELAILACKRNVVTKSLENVIEANLLLSGLGFESVGLAAAHAFYDAVSELPDVHSCMHGELVAIGVLLQHILDHEPKEQIRQTIDFFKRVGLPTKLSEIGIRENVDEKLMKIAQDTPVKGDCYCNFPFEVTVKMLYDALKLIDELDAI